TGTVLMSDNAALVFGNSSDISISAAVAFGADGDDADEVASFGMTFNGARVSFSNAVDLSGVAVSINGAMPDPGATRTVASGVSGIDFDNVTFHGVVVGSDQQVKIGKATYAFARESNNLTVSQIVVKYDVVYAQMDGSGYVVIGGETITDGVFDTVAEAKSALNAGGKLYVFNLNSGTEQMYFNINDELEAIYQGSTMSGYTGSTSIPWGGAIFADAKTDLELDNVVMTGNRGKDGGAFYAKGSNIVISGGTFSDNIADEVGNGDGGVFYIGGSDSAAVIDVAIASAVFSGNTADRFGGVAYDAQSASFTLSGSTFSGNTAGTRGGALALYGAATTISGSTFAGNAAGDCGGAIYLQKDAGTLTLDGSSQAVVFDGNGAESGGGALWVRAGAATLTGDVRFLTASDDIYLRGDIASVSLSVTDADLDLNADLIAGNGKTGEEFVQYADKIGVSDSRIVFGNSEAITVSTLNFSGNNAVVLNGSAAVNFASQDLSDVMLTVNGSAYVSDVTVATGVSAIGSYTVIGDADLFLKLDGTDLVMYERAADLKDGDAPVGNYKGTGDSNLITGGKVEVAFFGTTQASGNVRTVFAGGTVVNSAIGGALVLAGSSAGLGAVTLDIRDGVSLLGGPSNGGMNYVAGYAYGANASPAARDDAKCLTVDSAVLNLSGSSINGNLYAGAHARKGAWTEVTATTITVTGGIVEKLYGGGWAERYGQSDVGTATVNISGGSINRLYAGGGNGSNAYTYTTTADLTISGGTVDYVFLGGRNINCFVGDATLTITGDDAMTLTRISGHNDCGVDNTTGTAALNVRTDVTVDYLDYVDRINIAEGGSLAIGELALYDDPSVELAVNLITDGVESDWTVLSGASMDVLGAAQFYVNDAAYTEGGVVIGQYTYELTFGEDSIKFGRKQLA
ncbi:MAG: hypothetical protein MR051_04715, partial [Lentisphaeria bacterium]|nr:hypothetical protein [Lentisphaeria bacterium]